MSSAPDLHSRFRGCLLGGALGDALGAPVEFLRAPQIDAKFGPAGPVGLEPAYGRRGAVTDDTQMTMFTVEGLIRAQARFNERGICHPPAVVQHAYLRWLHTQGQSGPTPWRSQYRPDGEPDGWLVEVKGLYANRAPGLTCLGALKSGQSGTPERPINDSKGCGGVMRVAPAGLVAHDPFDFGTELAALTHGHPSGYLSAGYLSATIAGLCAGLPLAEAAQAADEALRGRSGAEETQEITARARALALAGAPSRAAVSSLGEGWTGEEALAIALYCAMVAERDQLDFKTATRLAVNHSGDSDSTGAICGNLLGAAWGEQVLPTDWLEELELREEIASLADDLYRYSHASDEVWQTHGGGRDAEGRIQMPWSDRQPDETRRYPGW